MCLEHNRYSPNGQFYYYYLWAGEPQGGGDRVPRQGFLLKCVFGGRDDCCLGACLEEALGTRP